MPVHRFGRADHQLVGMRAKYVRNGGAFGFVIGCSPGTVCIYITHVFGIDFGILQRTRDGARGALF